MQLPHSVSAATSMLTLPTMSAPLPVTFQVPPTNVTFVFPPPIVTWAFAPKVAVPLNVIWASAESKRTLDPDPSTRFATCRFAEPDRMSLTPSETVNVSTTWFVL